MNEQRFFDEALAHIRQQGEPSVEKAAMPEGASFCIYNGPEGRRCAFGPAIMTFDPAMEGESADIYPKDNLHPWARDLNSSLINNVQAAHDTSSRLDGRAFLKSFERKMKTVARDYNVANLDVDKIVYQPPA